MDRIAVIILNYNGKNDTLECLGSLSQSEGVSYTPIVVDNGSSDGSCDAIHEEFQGTVLIKNEKNLGFAGGNNKGITYALEEGFSHICLLNNDTTVHPHCLKELLSHSDHKTILGGKLLNAKKPSLLDHLGGRWNAARLDFDLVGLGNPASEFTNPLVLDYICGCLFFSHRTVFEKIGMLYEPYFLYWEESDYCFRAKKKGILSKYCPEAIVYHKGAITTEKKSPLTHYYAQRNRLLFLTRNITLTKLQKRLLRKMLFRKWKHFFLHLLQYPFSKKRRRLLLEKAELRGIFHALLGRFGRL